MSSEVTPICPDCGEELYKAMWENEHGLVTSEIRCGGCETSRVTGFPTVFVDGPESATGEYRTGGASPGHRVSADD